MYISDWEVKDRGIAYAITQCECISNCNRYGLVSRYTIELQLSHRVKDHTFNVYCIATDHDVNMDASKLLERLSMTQYYCLKIVNNFNTIHSSFFTNFEHSNRILLRFLNFYTYFNLALISINRKDVLRNWNYTWQFWNIFKVRTIQYWTENDQD